MAVGIIQGATPSVQHQLFPAKYFTGADCGIYFGDTFIDDIVHLEFSLQERVLPLMGYASHTFHRVARGARQIQGSFTINFRNAGYLYAVMDHIGRMAKTEQGAIPYVARLLNAEAAKDQPEWIAKAHESIEQLLDRVHKPKVVKKIPERWYVPLRIGDGDPLAKDIDPAWNQKVESIGYLKDALFRRGFLSPDQAISIKYFDMTLSDAIVRFQKSYGINWDGSFDLTTSQQLTDVEYDRPLDGLDSASRMQEMEKQIWGTGASPDDEARYRPYFNSGEFTSLLADKGFDIYIIYGALDQTAAYAGAVPRAASFPYTVRALFGVQITGSHQIVSADGRHIMEQYNFIARDLDINSAQTELDQNRKPVTSKRISPQEVMAAPGIPKDARRVTVKFVSDGDTFILDDQTHIRLIGADTPEVAKNHPGEMTVDDPFGKEATDFMRRLIEGKPVWIKIGIDPTDKYGRTLAWMWTEDGLLLSYELIKRGFAKVMIIGKNNLFADLLHYAEKTAKDAKIGLWSVGSKSTSSGGNSYTVKYGDTLWDIAEKTMGNGLRWSELYAHNRDTIGPNSNNLPVGMKLNIP